MRVLSAILVLLSLVLVLPAQASRDSERVQAANTLLGMATTDPSVINLKPDQMTVVAWDAPFIRFPGEMKWVFIRVKVLPGSNGQFLNQIAPKLEAASRFLWGENADSKNIQVGKNGNPEPHDYVFDLELSYVVGQNSNRSSSGGSSRYSGRNGSYHDSRSDLQETVTQESHLSLTAELVEYKMRGNNDGVIAPSTEISAFENGTISVSGSTSGSNYSNSTYRGRTLFGGRAHPYSVSDQHYERWSWTNSGSLLEERSAESLAKYLAKGAYAQVCQAIKAKQAMADEASKPRPLSEQEMKNTKAP